MQLCDLTKALFPGGCEFQLEGNIIIGTASANGERVEVIGIINDQALGVDEALRMSARVLEVVKDNLGVPLVILIATKGQKMELRDELLGLNQYLAHLCKCLEMARQKGHRIVAVISGQALGGALIATGLMADMVIALEDAHPSVMPIEGIARITKVSKARLEELARQSSVFAPGANHFFELGGVHILRPPDAAVALCEALGSVESGRRRFGLVEEVINKVMAYAP